MVVVEERCSGECESGHGSEKRIGGGCEFAAV